MCVILNGEIGTITFIDGYKLLTEMHLIFRLADEHVKNDRELQQ